MQTIVLRRAYVVWYVIPFLVAFGLYDWHQFLIGAPVRSSMGDRSRAYGMMGLPLAIIAGLYDLYARFIRRDRLEFSDTGIADYASSDRLGEIRWEAVDGVAVNRKLFGDSIIVSFKQGVALNEHVENWDRIIIGSLKVSDQDMAGISALLNVWKIPGGEDEP